jgi:hypothetical protein
LSYETKKRVKGVQSPQNGCNTGIREVQISGNPDGPLINVPVGHRGEFVRLVWLVDSGAGESVMDETSFKENYPGMDYGVDGWIYHLI